jgi:hypothetical protein
MSGNKKMSSFLGFFGARKSDAQDKPPASSGTPVESSLVALERFMAHVNRDSLTRLLSQDGVGSPLEGSAPVSRKSSKGSMDLPTSPNSMSETQLESREGLLPTFHQVPLGAILAQAEVALVSLDRLVNYMEERYKLEVKHARERAKLKLDLRVGGHPDDSLENLLQAQALYEDVLSTQTLDMLEEFDKVRPALCRHTYARVDLFGAGR